MFIQLNDLSYIALNQIKRYEAEEVEYISSNGQVRKAKVDHTTLDAIEILSNKFIEVLDSNENIAIIPIDTITAIRKLQKVDTNQHVCAVKTTSGEVFYMGDGMFGMFESLTLAAYEFGEVP